MANLLGTVPDISEIYGHLENATLQGLSAYEVAVANGYTGTEAEWLASLKGETGETPDIQVGTVQTGQPGTNANANITGTKENPVLNMTIPRGNVGATPNMAIGTVTTGEEGSQAQATITGTPENPVLNLTIPKGDTGDDGFNPVVEVTKSGNTATVSVTDATHTTEVDIVDGYTPQKNVDYFDGHTPVITGSKSQGTTFIYSDGEQIGAVADGEDGYTPRKGVDYFDGHTPVIAGEKIDDTTFIYADGVRIATVLDGLDGNSPVITTVKSGKTTSILADSVVIGTISDGADGHTPTITTTKSGTTTTILSDGTSIGTVTDGADGHSPEITTSKDGKTLTIMSDGQAIGTVSDGADAIPPTITTTKSGKTTTILADGKSIGTIVDGNDGTSSTVTVSKSGNTTTVYVDGTASAQIQDGADGHTPIITASKSGINNFIYSDGNLITTINDGAVGRTPDITAIKNDGITTISSDGVSIATINDGAKGDPGQDGVSPSATVTQTANGATITITDKDGTTTANLSNGQPGSPGEPGEDGHTPVKGTDYWTAQDKASIVSDVLNSQEISKINQDISDLSNTVSGKYSKPSTGIPASDLASGVIPDVSGKTDKVQSATSGNFASLDANGNLTDSGHKHSDYLTEHQSLANCIKNTDFASVNLPGISAVSADYGVGIRSADRHLYVNRATTEIKSGTNNYKPIVPNYQHESAFYGLAKAAGDTTQSASSNDVGNYTETAQSKIHEMLDAPVTVSGTTPTITGKAGIRYICGEVSTLSITPPASGDMEVIFESGSTATVLTVPNTVKFPAWFDATDLEANCTYDIIITNGTLGVVTSWA